MKYCVIKFKWNYVWSIVSAKESFLQKHLFLSEIYVR